MISSAVFSLALIFGAICTSGLPYLASCDSCGKECQSACGTRGFRICCFNYLKKRSTPVSAEPERELEATMVLPKLNRYYSSLRFLIGGKSDRNQKQVFVVNRKLIKREDSSAGETKPIFLTNT